MLDNLLDSKVRKCAIAFRREGNKPIRKINIPLSWRQSSFLRECKDWPSKNILKNEGLIVNWHCLVHPEVVKLTGKINYCSKKIRVYVVPMLVDSVNVKGVGVKGQCI